MLHFIKHARVRVHPHTEKEEPNAEKGGSGSLHLAGACRPVEDESLTAAFVVLELPVGPSLHGGARAWPPSGEGERSRARGRRETQLLPEPGCSRSRRSNIPPQDGKIGRGEEARCSLHRARVMEMFQLQLFQGAGSPRAAHKASRGTESRPVFTLFITI